MLIISIVKNVTTNALKLFYGNNIVRPRNTMITKDYKKDYIKDYIMITNVNVEKNILNDRTYIVIKKLVNYIKIPHQK